MLATLRLHNFIVIEEQTVQFDTGFTALSGESGAGKSVLVRALDFVCGGKLSLSPIRSDKLGEAEVEAQFIDVAPLNLTWLSEQAVESEPVTEYVLRRSYSANGRTRGWINGRLATVAQMQELAEELISITSQSQSVRLRHPAVQRAFFDSFADARPLANEMQERFSVLMAAEANLANLRAAAEQAGMRKASLEFIINELSDANVTAGRREELDSQLRKLSQSSKLQGSVSELSHLGIESALSKAAATAREVSPELAERAESLRLEWEGLIADLMRAIKGYRSDATGLERLSEELAEIARLERKYRTNDAGLVSMLEKARAEIALFEALEPFDVLERNIASQRSLVLGVAQKLSAKRKSAAKLLSTALQQQLKDLGLDAVSLNVKLTPLETLHAYGLERVEFVMNLKGQPESESVALGASVSGGELSRIFLALMVACGGASNSDTLVFDEIDSGVSGQAARVVGDKLRALGAKHQVLCVTHLPQVASLATSNLRVTKTPGIPPGSSVERLNKKEKVEEIARMLAGYVVTDQARKSADELISS